MLTQFFTQAINIIKTIHHAVGKLLMIIHIHGVMVNCHSIDVTLLAPLNNFSKLFLFLYFHFVFVIGVSQTGRML